MFCLTCTTIISVDLAHYIVSRAKDKLSGNCGTNDSFFFILVVDLKTLMICRGKSVVFVRL